MTAALIWPAIVTFGALGVMVVALLLLYVIPAKHRRKINGTTIDITRLFFCVVLIAICLWFINQSK